ncbi:hypothetical protein KFE80_03760 [bacterium SCSIO 12696]|nr:hypothetical protein KFE80_03760 [bacterium SCSIO 12696]
MRFLFVENRYKTFFWEAIAESLISKGHEIFWLVQNKNFRPSSGVVYQLPYPRKKDLVDDEFEAGSALSFIKSCDRNINYFGGSSAHYRFYFERISEALNEISPDVSVGEPTLFHELMVVDWCNKNCVPYLHPSSPGYPTGRLTVYSGWTKSSYAGSGDEVSVEDCISLIKEISERNVVPDYMKDLGAEKRELPRPGSVRDKIRILSAYLSGERFNTPSPIRKFKLNKLLSGKRESWNLISEAKSTALGDKCVLMYPMHMQPEANIDVWGNAWRDQTDLIRRLADMLPDDWILAVKPNPKMKYELTKELLGVVSSEERVVPISLDVKMEDFIQRVDAVVTVTGTIAIECLLSRIPVATLGPSVVKGYRGVFSSADLYLGDLSCLRGFLKEVQSGSWTSATTEEMVGFVKSAYSETFSGLVSDPMFMPECVSSKNVGLVVSSLISVIGSRK